jgi:uncharacterized membrane protein YesL
MNFLGRSIDVLFLNFLWLAFCLPIVTIGAATAAAYGVTLKMVDNEEGYIARSFFKEFKASFKRGTLLWLLNCIGLYALYIDWQLVFKAESPSILITIAGILSAAFVFCAFIYAYPLIARYDTPLKNAIKNSLGICFRYPIKTLMLAAVMAIEIAVFAWNKTMAFFGVLAGPMILMYTVSGVSKKIFKEIENGR